MAYVYDPDKKNVQQGQVTPDAPMLDEKKQFEAPTPHMQDEGRGTDRFLNLSKVFNANAGAAAQSARTIADRTQRQGQTAQGEIGQGLEGFRQGVKSGSVTGYKGETVFDPTNTHDINSPNYRPTPDTSQHITATSTGDSVIPIVPGTSAPASGSSRGSSKQGLRDDTRGVDYDQAVRNSNATYTGPMGWSDDKVQQDAMDAGMQARGLNDFDQRQAMLGNSMLNSALAGAAGGHRFAQLSKQFGGLDNQYNQAVQTASNEASDAKALSAQAAEQWGGALDSYDAAHLNDYVQNVQDPSATAGMDKSLAGGNSGDGTALNAFSAFAGALNPAAGALVGAGSKAYMQSAADQKRKLAQAAIARGEPDPWNGDYGDSSRTSSVDPSYNKRLQAWKIDQAHKAQQKRRGKA